MMLDQVLIENLAMKNYLHEHVWVSSKAAGVSGLKRKAEASPIGSRP